jgi:osmotically-inducible protein OsmY
MHRSPPLLFPRERWPRVDVRTMRDETTRAILPLALAGLLLAMVPAAGCRKGTQEEEAAASSEAAGQDAGEQAGGEEAGAEAEIEDVDIEDAGITAKVKTQLAADERVSAFAVNVSTRQRIVTLKGSVEDEEAKAAAEEIARGTEGVSDVVNMITIGGGDSSAA